MLLPSIIASPNTHEGERYSRSIASVSLPGTVFMGALCCCPCPEDFDEYAYSSNPIYQHCICLRYFFHQLLYGYGATFQRLDGRTNPTQIQTITSSTTSVSRSASDNSLSEAHHHVPRPPPYETDARYSRSQREGLVSRREKSMSHIQENLHILRRNGSSSTFETMASIKKRNIVESDEECIHTQSESEKNQSAKACEYTPENPKIVANCSHHFHLSCIYEWMERSDTCPVCGKEMQFCESP
ncbi:E3 ubiquitin-protein ligase At3g02290-like isoform X2 [Curcuma longa]|uniref:E3 ubiquitin-protein ligase At3g02290-like isoform X2 n=1 Tax=Curcuma longa TaxID=136217 RepID=UPI003D9E7685